MFAPGHPVGRLRKYGPKYMKKYHLLNCTLKNICFAKMKKAHCKIQIIMIDIMKASMY